MDKESILDELNIFGHELLEYSDVVLSYVKNEILTKKRKARGAELYTILSKKVGYLGIFISELSGISKANIQNKDYDIWLAALQMPADKLVDNALSFCIQATNRAIGKLEDDIKKGIRDEQGNIIKTEKTAEKDTVKLPIQLFDAMQFHPRVVEASRSLFKDKHYADAIFRAFTAVSTYVKEKSGSSLDGKSLMSSVFSEEKPIIKINDFLTPSDRDEQEGFKFIFMGGQVGIRNPKAHDNIVQTDPYRTLEYLSLASLLMKRIEEGKVVKL